jgi:hypothetical protein
MTANHPYAAWLRSLAGLVALAGVFVLSACGGGSGAPNNPFAAPPAPIPVLAVFPSTPTIYSQVASTLTLSGGVAPYRAFSSNAAILPVTQSLPGNTITLLAATVSSTTFATITIQDSAGTSITTQVTILPGPVSPPPPLVVLPSPVDVYSTISTQLTVSGGVPPFRAFSSNTAVLPVTQSVSGSIINLLATTVTEVTPVVVTVQDSVGQSAPVTVTVHPKPVIPPPPLIVLPTDVIVSKGVSATLTISGGLAPFKAYSSNPAVVPVNQSVTGNSIVLVAAGVAVDTSVTVTIQDSAGQTVRVAVLVQALTPAPALSILPANPVVFSGVPAVLSVTGGVPPYKAFSGNTGVLPVTQAVAGGSIPLLASNVAADTTVDITVQDSRNASTTTAVTVRPAALLNNLTIKPNAADCGTNAICSGQTGTATITVQLPGGGPAPGRQVRYDVIAGPYFILANDAPVLSSIVVSDAAGNATVIIRANVDAPTQPAQVRATDVASGQQLTGDFLIQQRTDGVNILTVVPSEANIKSALAGVCSTDFRVDYFIYGGTAPYRVTQSFPTGATLLNSIVNTSGGFFEVVTNGTCVNPMTFSIVDKTGRQTTATLNNLEGTGTLPPPSELQIVPGDLTPGVCTGATFDFVITGGTAPYNVSASPRVGNSPTITPSTVTTSGGSTRISNIETSITLSFVDSSSPQKTATRKITCPPTAGPTALVVNPTRYDYKTSTCTGKSSGFIVTGGTPPYNLSFPNPSAGTISPTTVPASGGGFVVTGLTDSSAGGLFQTFISVTDSAGQQVFPEILCP